MKNYNSKACFRWISGIFCVLLFNLFAACGDSDTPKEVVLVDKTEEVPMVVSGQISELLSFLTNKDGYLNDSTQLSAVFLLQRFYESNNFQPVWSEGDHWKPAGDSMFFAISQSKLKGLFPSDYYHHSLLEIRNKIILDSISRKNAALWARADLLLTDACWKMAQNLKYGHLQKDSITIRKDTALTEDRQMELLQSIIKSGQVEIILSALEPTHAGYQELKKALPHFLADANFQPVDTIAFPAADSLAFVAQVAGKLKAMRLLDSSWMVGDDSVIYSKAVKKYQASKGIITTGVVAQLTVKSLNTTDWDFFKTIALNLDRYRQLPDTLPETYVWVNLPSYKLKVVDYDTVALESKIIVGSPKTPTPVLNSTITNFITYPQWTVPYSIIFKEMLPKIRKDINYLAKENLMVVDKYDSVIAPETIDWETVTRNKFPYLLRQRQGDDNSLGVMKFNFWNKYSVYLHDTNARSLFSKETRALSHGCVRVQQWEKLSHFLVRNNEIRYHPDTIRALISRQEKKTIGDFPRVPIYIRYITAEGKDGKIQFFADIYEEDKRLKARYYASKSDNP
ncbi:L,D-transpeptidase family protein [Flavihumibacter sp. UBA7668]|uniref:L,D-transpeptidase family protein n=1 Tax=Flavihumibacter sp. UBA7668 TaxID=1946542 RepID=UPI0025C4A928|nr:L,D-transpeptidase family protein [Flavihumibacter sp. UBA7668]